MLLTRRCSSAGILVAGDTVTSQQPPSDPPQRPAASADVSWVPPKVAEGSCGAGRSVLPPNRGASLVLRGRHSTQATGCQRNLMRGSCCVREGEAAGAGTAEQLGLRGNGVQTGGWGDQLTQTPRRWGEKGDIASQQKTDRRHVDKRTNKNDFCVYLFLGAFTVEWVLFLKRAR